MRCFLVVQFNEVGIHSLLLHLNVDIIILSYAICQLFQEQWIILTVQKAQLFCQWWNLRSDALCLIAFVTALFLEAIYSSPKTFFKYLKGKRSLGKIMCAETCIQMHIWRKKRTIVNVLAMHLSLLPFQKLWEDGNLELIFLQVFSLIFSFQQLAGSLRVHLSGYPVLFPVIYNQNGNKEGQLCFPKTFQSSGTLKRIVRHIKAFLESWKSGRSVQPRFWTITNRPMVAKRTYYTSFTDFALWN